MCPGLLLHELTYLLFQPLVLPNQKALHHCRDQRFLDKKVVITQLHGIQSNIERVAQSDCRVVHPTRPPHLPSTVASRGVLNLKISLQKRRRALTSFIGLTVSMALPVI